MWGSDAGYEGARAVDATTLAMCRALQAYLPHHTRREPSLPAWVGPSLPSLTTPLYPGRPRARATLMCFGVGAARSLSTCYPTPKVGLLLTTGPQTPKPQPHRKPPHTQTLSPSPYPATSPTRANPKP